MKKQVALALAAALSLSVAGTALAAPANPFVDVPANHWAYDAIKDLQMKGIVSGYGDNTFRGDRTLTRYEMAAMVAKITSPADGKDGATIKRLQSEFATELYNLGVRVDNLEKNASTIKFTGDARIRYQQGNTLTNKDTNNTSRFQERVRINMNADVNEKTKFIGRLRWDSTSNAYDGKAYNTDTANTEFTFDRAEFAYTNGNFGLSAGRLSPKLGQGLIWWDERADGFVASYSSGKFVGAIGYVDLGAWIVKPGAPGQSTNVGVAHLGYQFNDNFGLTAAMADAAQKDVQLMAFGTSVKFAQDFNLTGEWIKNNDAPSGSDDSGWWTRLQWKQANMKKPGSYYVYADYYSLGGDATLGTGMNRFAELPAYSSGKLGIKGWGVSTRYVVAKNVNVEAYYGQLKPYDKGRAGFDKYNNSFMLGTNFLF